MKMKLAAMFLGVLVIAGCSCSGETNDNLEAEEARYGGENGGPAMNANPTSLEPCGEFEPATYDDAVVVSRYAVCRNASDGTCYIKTHYPVPKQGCDLKFGQFQNGDPACFDWIHNIHDNKTGEQFGPQSLKEYREGDTCGWTTEAYFRAKVSK